MSPSINDLLQGKPMQDGMKFVFHARGLKAFNKDMPPELQLVKGGSLIFDSKAQYRGSPTEGKVILSLFCQILGVEVDTNKDLFDHIEQAKLPGKER